MTGKNADLFKICEADTATPFYNNMIKEKIKIA